MNSQQNLSRHGVPVPTIANTMDVAKSIGEGRSIGYGFSSTWLAPDNDDATGVSTPPSVFSSSFGLEYTIVLGIKLEICFP